MATNLLKPTDEQQAILDAAATGKTIAISAGAGTGKTSTLRMIAEARPRTKMLYVAYNKAIQVEAEKSFPSNVSAKTAHSLAYKEFGAPMRDRLSGPRMRGADTARILGVRADFGFDEQRIFTAASQASLAMGMVARFCRSADDEIAAHHFHPPEGLSDDEAAALARHLLPLARRAWADLSAGPRGKCHPTHDVYLKQWQLSKPSLSGFDVILYDESQDADPAIADVVEHQSHAQLIAVGDSAQAIYCQPAGTAVRVVRERAECQRGHELSAENLYTYGAGKRRCKTCAGANLRDWKRRGGGRRPERLGAAKLHTVEVPIEEVQAGDRVVSYNIAHSVLRRSGCVVTRNEARTYDGALVAVQTASGLVSRYTPEHECVVRFGEAWRGKWVLYLMGSRNRYRVGVAHCRYESQNGRLGAVARAQQEGADAVWILSLHDSRPEAHVAEAVAAWRYGVPDLTFTALGDANTLTQENLDRIWEKIGSTESGARRLLAEHGRDIRYPLWSVGERFPSVRRCTVVRACNLLDGMEVLPAWSAYEANGKRVTHQRWEPVLVRREHYTGRIYSLSVEGDHTYLADGIVTHNSWRGAGNFLHRVDAEHRLMLTQSWRFGQAVADEANVWLGVVGTGMRIVGNPKRASKLESLDRPETILCRSNAGTIDAVLDAHDHGVRVHLVGDGKEMLALARAAERLQDGKPAGHLELATFSTWDQVVEYAEKDPGGSDLAVAVRMIEKYGAGGVVAAIDGTVAERSAQLIVSTAHKAKGLEWSTVRIAGDFPEPLDKKTGEALPIPRADAMLAYVAVTRAMDGLDTGGLAWVHDHLEALGTPSGWTVDGELTPSVLPAPVAGEDRASPAPTPLGRVSGRLDAASAASRDALAGTAQEHVSHLETEQSTERTSEDPTSQAKLCPCPPAITAGTRVLVAEERGIYVVTGQNADGSFTCYPHGEHGAGARSFRPEWCVPAERPGREGEAVRVRTVPLAARRARALWRAQHGLLSVEHAQAAPGTRPASADDVAI